MIPPAAQIKGRHTLLDTSVQCQVALSELLLALGLPPGTGVGTPIKDLVGTGAINDIQQAAPINTYLPRVSIWVHIFNSGGLA